MRIILQFPQGLKQHALREQKELEKKGHTVFLSSTPCWGACDLCLDEAKKVGADKLIHYGHAKYHEVKEDIEVEYHLFPIDVDLDLLKRSLPKIKEYKKIGLVTTVTHNHQLEDMKAILVSDGHEVFTEKGRLAILEGQVLGCDATAASTLSENVDCIIYVGGGEFHPLAIDAKIPIFSINPYADESYFMNELIERKRKKELGMLIATSQAKTIGIIVSTKSGQFRLAAAEAAADRLRQAGKEVSILISSEIDFNSLSDFNSFDAYITTACPRLIDDSERAQKPIINLSKLKDLIELIEA